MKKILFVADVENWAYDYQAKNWKEVLKGKYDIDIIYLSKFPQGGFKSQFSIVNRKFLSLINNDNAYIDLKKINSEGLYYYSNEHGYFPLKKVFSNEDYDAILFFYSKAASDKRLLSTYFDLNKTIVCINNEKWTDIGAEEFYNYYLQGIKVVACCNKNILKEFSKYAKNCLRLSQCVPNSFLVTKQEAEAKFKKRFNKKIVGFSGNIKNNLKNFENIKKACDISGVNLVVAKKIPQSKLPLWYKQIDLIICASTSEGGPMCLLEAGASAVPVLSTRVGLCRELIGNDTGELLESIDPNHISKKINYIFKNKHQAIQRSLNLRDIVERDWTYSSRDYEIINVIKSAIKS